MGRFVSTATGGENVRAYIPPPLPPVPPVALDGLMVLIEQANRALGRLDGVTSILPSPPLFLFMYVRKEALLSSQIEGTQSSLSDLLLFENDEIPLVPLNDVQEVSNYVAAMNLGLKRLGDSRCAAQARAWQQQAARRVSHDAKLDRRHSSRQRAVRAAATKRVNGLPR
jgi:Fic family protein